MQLFKVCLFGLCALGTAKCTYGISDTAHESQVYTLCSYTIVKCQSRSYYLSVYKCRIFTVIRIL